MVIRQSDPAETIEMKLIIENWRKFLKESSTPQDLEDIANQPATFSEEPDATQADDWLHFVKRVMEVIVARGHGTSIEADVDYAIYRARHGLEGEDVGRVAEIENEREAEQWLTQNKEKVMKLHPKYTIKEVAKVNTRLMSRIMATRDSAARQGRWDLVDACAALLKRSSQGEYNFKAFEGQLESAFASSNPGETLNAAADAIMDSYRKLSRKSTVNESAFLPRVQHAELAHRLAGAVNKFGFRKLSPSEYDDLGKHLEGLGTETSPFDARNSIIDFLVGKGLATRSLFYNIK